MCSPTAAAVPAGPARRRVRGASASCRRRRSGRCPSPGRAAGHRPAPGHDPAAALVRRPAAGRDHRRPDPGGRRVDGPGRGPVGMSAPGSTGSPGGTGAGAPPAAAAAAADRALRRHLDAEATAALAEALAARAGQPPLADPVQPAEGADAGQPTDTWAAALRAATRRSVATALADSLAPPPAPPTPQPPQYTLTEWVEHIYANTFIRRLGQTQRWCASWWAHAEAIVRLEALWRTWEAAA